MGADASKFAVADDLNEEQRHFYERAKLKLAVSLTSAAFGMMLLGFASIAGGNAQFQNYVKEHVAGEFKLLNVTYVHFHTHF